MSQEMDDLKKAVADEDTVIASAVAAFQGIATQIADAAGDKQASLDLAKDVNSQAQALAAAIPQNTPAAVPTDGAPGVAGSKA